MINFKDDYSIGAHPKVLAAIQSVNDTTMPAYGEDPVSDRARKLIQNQISTDVDIYFVTGGTLANLIMIAGALRPHEAVIAPEFGHINTHETGAIEATGHKIIQVPSQDGKLNPEALIKAYDENTMPPHMAKPRLVYISNATETGRVYTRSELEKLSQICRERDLYLMIDGARLSAALASPINDLNLSEIAKLADMFWIGGTKAGALFGEAIVLSNPELKPDFDFHVKQRGALLSKGRFLGAQFEALFSEHLYIQNGAHANQMAQSLSEGVTSKGFPLQDTTESNQVFPILSNDKIKALEDRFSFYHWANIDADQSIIRLVTSFTTQISDVDEFIDAL